jgi:hypothetical protein
MATTEAHVGEKLKGKVTLFDDQGNPGASYDEAAGIIYAVDNPSIARVTDADAEPMDCEVEALALGTALVSCTLDTRKGTATNTMRLEGTLTVVPGEARSGTLEFELVQVQPRQPTP